MAVACSTWVEYLAAETAAIAASPLDLKAAVHQQQVSLFAAEVVTSSAVAAADRNTSFQDRTAGGDRNLVASGLVRSEFLAALASWPSFQIAAASSGHAGVVQDQE